MVAMCMLYSMNPVFNYLFYKFSEGERPNLSAAQEKKFIDDKRFLLPLYVYVTLDTLSHLWALCVVSDQINFDSPFFANKLDSPTKWFGFMFVMGYCCGIGGLAGHGLIHKKDRFNKFLGTLAFARQFYAHFFLEHISGHHKKVATTEDPATPLKGEGLWEFLPRSVIYGYFESWERESERINLLY